MTEPHGGTLYVVATPIGNLGDVTFRSLEVLRGVPLVAAEDTRVARKLFTRHGISTPLVSYHARNAADRADELLDHLEAGRDLALVTDAGTPAVSDPGAELAAAWAARGGAVVPIPGASAVLAALVASGFVAPRWSFEGFLPRREGSAASGSNGSPQTIGRRSSSNPPGGRPPRSLTWLVRPARSVPPLWPAS